MKKELVTCVRMYGVFFTDYYETQRWDLYFYSNEERLKYFPEPFKVVPFAYKEPKFFTLEEGEKEYKKAIDYVKLKGLSNN